MDYIDDNEVTPQVVPISKQEYLAVARRAVKEEKLQALSGPNGYLFKLANLVDSSINRMETLNKRLNYLIIISSATLLGFLLGCVIMRVLR